MTQPQPTLAAHGEGDVAHCDWVRVILGGNGDAMPRKYQNPKLQTRPDVKRPFYFVRVSVPTIRADGRRQLQRQSCSGEQNRRKRKDG